MAKQLLPSQHDILHQTYAPIDCCLCQAEKRVKELERALRPFVKYFDALSESLVHLDGNITYFETPTGVHAITLQHMKNAKRALERLREGTR